MRALKAPEVGRAAADRFRTLTLWMVCVGTILPISAPALTWARPSTKVLQKQDLAKTPLSSFVTYVGQSLSKTIRSSCGPLSPETATRTLTESLLNVHRLAIPTLFAVLIVEAILIFVLFRNRRESKSAKQVLRCKEVELAETQCHAKVGSWAWNPKANSMSLSHALCNLLGIDPQLETMAFPKFSRFFNPESWTRLTQNLKVGLNTGTSFELEVTGFRCDGIQIWLIVRGHTVHDVADHILQLRGTMQDITESKRVEQALLDSEERSRLVAELIPTLTWWCGPDKRCTNVNKEWLRFTGRAMQEELGDGWLDSVHPDDLQTFLLMFTSPCDKGRSTAVAYRMRRNDGQFRWMRSTSSPRFLANEQFAGYMGCCTDVTDEKEAKAASAEFGSKLIRAQEEERARIARELHDDINQRLALLANGLENFGADHNVHDNVKRSHRDAKAQELWQLANEIATDIQHLSHQLHPSKVHYLGLTAAVRDLCQEFSRQHTIGVECIVQDLPKNLADEVSLNLYRAIQECLHNAAKHSQARRVKVELTRKSSLLHLCVSDDGIGFNPSDVIGKGLGLISMRERLRSIGGELFVWSRPSLGTQLEGTIPVTVRQARGDEAYVADKDIIVNSSPPSLLTVVERPRGI